jgi:hypothetical protein
MTEPTEQQYEDEPKESVIGAILGWGALAAFAIGFAWYIGAPLIVGERWANKADEAIQTVREWTPTGGDSLYDMIRAYSLRAKDNDVYIGQFSWDALQREGPEYEVTLLWTEGSKKKVAIWRVNLQSKQVRPQGNEASTLPQRISPDAG